MTKPVEKLLLPAERLRLSRERLRLALLARVPAKPAPGKPGAIDKALGWLKASVPGATEVAEAAGEHRTALIAAGLGLLVLITRPWRLLLKPKVLLFLAAPLAAYGLRKVPTQVWTDIAIGLAQRLWTRRKVKRQLRRRRRDARAWADTRPPDDASTTAQAAAPLRR